MRQKSTFDRLVSGLSSDERLEMLERIEARIAIDDEPFFTESEDLENGNIEIIYNRLGVLKRIVLFLRALFSQRDVTEILEESILKRYAGDVERGCRGLFDAKTMSLTGGFARELRALRDSLACFTDPLSRAFGPDKSDFISFLAGFEIPLHQERLLDIADPESHTHKEGALSDSDLRRKALLDLSAALKDISDSDKSSIYNHVRSLYFLSELVRFPFSSILEHFPQDQSEQAVSLDQVKTPLLELGDVLYSQGAPPSENALRALFLFDPALTEQADTKEIKSTLKAQLEKAWNGTDNIRKFMNVLPLRKLLKVCTGNLGYTPETLGGGEDWFALYRKFWEQRVETAVSEYSFKNRKNRLQRDACALIQMSEIAPLANYRRAPTGQGLTGRYEVTIAFLHHFLQKLFMRSMHRTLRIFLVDGDFYKSQNREQFTVSYEGLQRSAKLINELEKDLSTEGEIGGVLDQKNRQPHSDAPGHELMSAMLQAMDARFEKIIDSARDNLEHLINVVKGILYGQSGGRFDTLSNISYIGGSENEKLIGRLNDVLKQAEEAQRIMNELYDLERSLPD